MALVLEDVISEIKESRSLKPLKKLKKENLGKVAAHYGITPAVGATKSHILDLIKDHCVQNNIIDEVEEKPTAETAEVLKLRFEHKERRLVREKAREEAQRAGDTAEAEAQKACEAARELRQAELKVARELHELELKAERENHELEIKAEQENALLEAEK